MPKRRLDEYRRKRDPERTNEPFAAERASSGATKHGEFVVHQHAATRMHHDLRIEMHGTLRSFAVPRGPTLDPSEKRLAVETEDHPLEYIDFEAVIPEGNYGAGAMIVWDRGRVTYPLDPAEVGIEKGKIDFDLDGHKLRGRFGLIRTSDRKKEKVKQPEWLLVKKEDAHARPGTEITETEPYSVLSGLRVHELAQAHEIAQGVVALAEELGAKVGEVDGRRTTPMLCATSGGVLDDPDRIYELKLDGVRIIADRRDDAITLTYRSGRQATTHYPEVVRALAALPFARVVLDGEIVAFDESGRPSFQRLGRRIHVQRPTDVVLAARAVPVVYLVFDVLQIGDRDLRKLPLSERKEVLSRLIHGKGFLRTLDHLEGNGEALYQFCVEQKLEGVISKRAESIYREGPQRTSDWVKIKCEREDEFVIVGYTRGERGRRSLGALDLASYDDRDRLMSVGKVGSGLDDATIKLLLDKLVDDDTVEILGKQEPAPNGRSKVKPELVARVRYLAFTDEGTLRHPVFLGLRHDIDPTRCRTLPRSDDDPALAEPIAPEVATGPKRRVSLTNQTKVFWPAEGYTKGDLCAYYESIAPVLLPFLVDRPVMLVRYPDGIEGKSFYQWNLPKGTPSWVRSFPLRLEDEDGKDVHSFLVSDVDTLLYIANLGCIPLHVLASRTRDLTECDFLTMDFDLGGREMRDGVTLARTLHGILDEIGLEGFPKTSGQTGLHVFVPLGPAVTFETARMLADVLARLLEQRHFDIATTQRMKDKRQGKVYIDTGQTGTTRTIVAPYSVRAFKGARVSTPLTWDEVSYALDPRHFSILTVPTRIEERGDPYAELLTQTPDIATAIGKLGAMLSGG